MRVQTACLILVAGLAALTGARAFGAAVPVVVEKAAAQADPTNREPIEFQAVFQSPVTGFDASDVVFCGDPSGEIDVEETAPGDGTTYRIRVCCPSGDGDICISIPPGAAHTAQGEPNEASSSTDPCVLFDTQPPDPPIQRTPIDGAVRPGTSPVFAWDPPANTDASGIKNYRIVISGPIDRDYYTPNTSYAPLLTEGAYAWKINARDHAGNTGAWSAPWGLILDDTPPAPPAFDSATHAAFTWSLDPEVHLTVAGSVDATSGVVGYEHAWTDDRSWAPQHSPNAPSSWDEETCRLPDGEWWFHAVAVDAAGNWSAPTAWGPIGIDTEAPVVRGIADPLTLCNDPGKLYATADWSGIQVEDLLDPAPERFLSYPTGARLPIGTTRVDLRATDRAGNERQACFEVVVVNAEPPAIAVEVPVSGTRYPEGASIEPSWTIRSLAPIEEIRVEGMDDGKLDTADPGRHTFRLQVKDTTGALACASVPYFVSYGEREAWVLQTDHAGEQHPAGVFTSPGASEASAEAWALDPGAERLDIVCSLTGASEDETASERITMTLTSQAEDRLDATEILLVRPMSWNGTAYCTTIPAAAISPGQYTVWLGFEDGVVLCWSFCRQV